MRSENPGSKLAFHKICNLYRYSAVLEVNIKKLAGHKPPAIAAS
jgi:hypothetical protein